MTLLRELRRWLSVSSTYCCSVEGSFGIVIILMVVFLILVDGELKIDVILLYSRGITLSTMTVKCIHGRANNGYLCKECPGKTIEVIQLYYDEQDFCYESDENVCI